MMQVTNVKVGFSRLRRPADFEHQNPDVEFSATLDDGDCHKVAARTLMTDAVTVAYNALGYDVPEKIAKALNEGQGLVTVTTDAEPTEPNKGVEDVAEETAEKPKPRGRKPGSKNTRPKAGTKAAKEAEAAQKAAAAEAAAAEEANAPAPSDADDIPDEGSPMPQISTNPEDRVDPNDADSIPDDGEDTVEADEKAAGAVGMDDADDIPGDDEGVAAPETIEFTAQDLNAMIGKLLNEQRVTLKDAKSITRHFQVARVHDLDATQVLEARNMLEKMMEARKKDD